MILEYLLQNWTAILILLAFAVMLKTTVVLDQAIIRRMYILIIGLFVFSIAVFEEFYLEDKNLYPKVRVVLMAIRYSMTPLIIAMILYTFGKKARGLLFLPGLLVAVVNFISIPTGIVFRLDASNELVRGPLGYLPYIAVGVYCFVLVFILLRQSNRQVMETIPILFLCFAFVSGLGWPLIIGKRYSEIFVPTIVVALFLYYVFSILRMTNRDPLTGLFNRQAYYAAIKVNRKDITALISIDMNGLKAINDNEGHAAGDEALSTLCSTGGRVNLNGQAQFDCKAPLISRAQVEDRGLELSGWYFGQEGTLAIDGVEIETQTWQDNIITADIRALPDGSHVAAVTNADGAVNRAVFSTSSQDAEGRMLFERSHSVPVLYPAFIADQSHRIYGPMAISGGKIYTMTNTAKYKIVQAIWSYDIEQDSWERLPLPEGCDPQSIRDGDFASLRDRLYLYGIHLSTDESGLNVSRGCLWRYEPYGDFWEQLEIPLPDNAEGICALGDELFVVGGSVYDMQLEGAPADSDGAYNAGFYKADLARGALVRVGGKLPDDAAMVNTKVAAGKDRMYIYAEIDESYYDDTGETPASGAEYCKTVSGGVLYRVAYDGAENKISFEDLTGTLNETLGDGLRTEYEYKMRADTPGEHFAIAGLDTGVAIIGSSVNGEDVHIIYDTDEKAVLYDRATCYHKAFDPIAVSDGRRLYVIGYNGTELDVMYFRSQEITPQAAANESGAPGGTGGVSSGGMDPTVIGGVTIGLFAALVVVLSITRRKSRTGE